MTVQSAKRDSYSAYAVEKCGCEDKYFSVAMTLAAVCLPFFQDQ